jgi:membrane protein
VLNTIFGGVTSKPMVIGKLRDLGMIILVLLFFLVSTTILPMLEVISSAAERLGLMQYINVRLLTGAPFSIVSFGVSFLIFFILYYLIPYESLGKKTAAVSAFWAVVLWEMAKQGFGYYTGQFATAGKIFGAYVMLVMVVLWIYFSAIVFIIGAEIGQLYREKHTDLRSDQSPETASSRFQQHEQQGS